MARVLGANVYKGHQKEIGWFPISALPVAEKDPVFGVLAPKAMVFQWHGDTFDLPKGALALAKSDVYQNQAFKFNRAYALQFHVEITEPMIHEWLTKGQSEIQQAGVHSETIREDTKKFLPPLTLITDKIYTNLFD